MRHDYHESDNGDRPGRFDPGGCGKRDRVNVGSRRC
jgi:hypothetical protein